MIVIGMILVGIGAIGSLVSWIMVLIKMFQNEKPLIGILGIFCGLWAFIWGWTKASTLGLKKTMLIWSACIGVVILGQIITGIGAGSQAASGSYDTIQSR